MLQSPPSRRRGLKYNLVELVIVVVLSPPSRRRGLKLASKRIENCSEGRLLLGGVD